MMLCRDACWAVGLVCIMALGAMGHPHTSTTTVTPLMKDNKCAMYVQHPAQSPLLCAGEQDFILKRKQIVRESLSKLGITCLQHSVPHIALLGSGGGQRAVVSLVGSLYQLKKEGLLDAVLYMGGISGSAMSMGSLYSDPQWNTNLDAAVSRLSRPKVKLSKVIAWLAKTVKEEHFTLTDLWGALTCADITKQLDVRHLSEDGVHFVNPYPIYNAVNKNCLTNAPEKSKWFEITPHESGFTELSHFINTAQLGSRTHNVEGGESPEMDLVRLQGIMGSILACEEDVLKYVIDWLKENKWFNAYKDFNKRFCRIVWCLMELIRKTTKNQSVLKFLDKLQNIMKEHLKCNPTETTGHKGPDLPVAEQWLQKLRALLRKWAQSLNEGPNKNKVTWLINKIVSLILNWEWGTTENFLYKTPDATVPSCIRQEEHLQLIDAGILLNIPFVPFLGEKRDVDLLITLEFGAADTFTNLLAARDYAVKLNKPFPKIDEKILQEKYWPRDFYVFRGMVNEPTVVYMPLFNRKNSKDAEEIKARRKEFDTFQRSYSKEKIDFLLKLSKANIKNNREALLREINTAVQRRPFRRYSGHTFCVKTV